MINKFLAGFFCVLGLSTQAQVLRDINYSYQYTQNAFRFNWKVVKVSEGYQVYYEFQTIDTLQKINPTLELETRESISEKNGTALPSPPIRQSGTTAGSVSFRAESGQQIIAAKISVTAEGKMRTYFFHKPLPKNKSYFLVAGQTAILNTYIRLRKPVTSVGFDSSRQLLVSYYQNSFPAAAPPFAMAQARVPVTIKPDSLFSIDATAVMTLDRKGLYLVQQDTSSSEGIAFRVEDDYPKLGKLENLVAPLVYICTKQEIEKLKQVGNDKKKFDQLILTITGSQERARDFMRSYFKHVESANHFFSSYKEGWKTDRGMVYIIFGVPEEVYLFDDREVWEYSTDNEKMRLQFIKSPTIFDPENYVLIRDKNLNNIWYEKVDLWRKARF